MKLFNVSYLKIALLSEEIMSSDVLSAVNIWRSGERSILSKTYK